MQTLSIAQIIYRCMLEWLVNNENNMEGSGRGLFQNIITAFI
jgi:hypothetical protein